MPYLWLTHSDGRHYVRLLTDEEGRASDNAVLVEDRVYDAFLKHCEQDRVWQAFWNAIDNEQAMRRHVETLQPLEDAQREIERLKAELESHKRMEAHWKEAYAAKQDAAQSSESTCTVYAEEFTHIYPQAGCDVTVLPSEWLERAQDILAAFDAERAAEGMKYQGCCCEYGNHRLLSAAEIQKLRDAGFVVENDTEEVL